MKYSESKPKPFTGKKITYSSIVGQKSPKRCTNQFELIYKIKNRENQNLEESFQSMILLKSKNKIKRYQDDNEKIRNQQPNIKDVFDRINSKIHQHSKKTSPRLINLFQMNKNSAKTHFIPQSKIGSNRMRKTSQNKLQINMPNRVTTINSEKGLKKSKKSLESTRGIRMESRPQQIQYIMFENEILPLAEQTHKNLASLMMSTYHKSKLSLQLSERLQQHENEIDAEPFYDLYQKRATQIQKVWRGYSTRKQLEQSRRQSKADGIRIQTTVNNMFIELFQQIIDLDEEQMKVKLLRSFRQIISARQSSNFDATENQKNEKEDIIVAIREKAVEAEFQAQTNVLKCLLVTKTIKNDKYLSQIEELNKWRIFKREQMRKLTNFMEQQKLKTKSIAEGSNQLIDRLQSVQLLRQSPSVLLHYFQRIQKDLLSHSFYESQPEQSEKQDLRESSITHHTHLQEQPQNGNTLVEEYQKKQKIRTNIQNRILQQIGYFQVSRSPVNTTNIGVHIFLNDMLNFVEDCYKEEFLRWINMPYGYSPESRLKMLQGHEIKAEEDHLGMVEGVQNVLSVQILIEYHKQAQNSESVYSIYHQRALFDAFNQCLNVYRPYYSIKGPPYLWNNSQKALTFYYIAEENIEEVFEKTKQQILKHTSSLCGILSDEPQIPQSFDDLLEQRHGCNLLIAECRQDKLDKLQNQTVINGEWGMLEEEKTQTMLNLAELVFSQMLVEISKDILEMAKIN